MATTNTNRTPAEVVRQILEDVDALTPLRDAAEFLHIDERTLRRWIAQGRVSGLRTTHKRGGRILIPRHELERLLTSMVS
jgi:excisionase family DNA binding protein